MAFNRKGPYRPIIPRWSQNVGRMLAGYPEGREAWIICSRCNTRDSVDLFKLCEVYGPAFSLWNRRPKCPVCGEERFFTAHHNSRDFVRPLITDLLSTTAYLHEIYVETKGKV